MVEDWSTAISSARDGKMVASRGEVAVGVQMVVLQMGIVGVGCCGCVLVVKARSVVLACAGDDER